VTRLCGLEHAPWLLLLKRESQGDVAAGYCFDAIVSKISTSTPVGALFLSAHSETVVAGAKMPVRKQRQVSIKAVTRAGYYTSVAAVWDRSPQRRYCGSDVDGHAARAMRASSSTGVFDEVAPAGRTE
jgi:hypothetical protein